MAAAGGEGRQTCSERRSTGMNERTWLGVLGGGGGVRARVLRGWWKQRRRAQSSKTTTLASLGARLLQALALATVGGDPFLGGTRFFVPVFLSI